VGSDDDYPEWPAELAQLVAAFREEERQDWLETPMDRGPPKRRPKGPPYSVLAADLELSATSQARLAAFVAQVYARPFRFPGPTGRVVVGFDGPAPVMASRLTLVLRILRREPELP
jgi:hypothetical protein